MKITLYQFWRSSASWRVRWALAIKRLPHEIVTVDLPTGQHRLAAFRAHSPLTTVPALVIDGRSISESVAILEHLETLVPSPSLYPADPWRRARTRQIVELINSGTQPYQTSSVQARHSDDDAERRAWVRHWNERGLAACEELLAICAAEGVTGRFAIGDELTAADLCVVPQLTFARRFDVDLGRYPRLLAVEAAALATEHAAAVRPEHQPGAPATTT